MRAVFAFVLALMTYGCASPPHLPLEARWDYANPAQSEATFRKLLAEDATLRPSERLEVETQIARALGLQERYDEAAGVLDDVERAGSRSAVVAARLHLERGRLLRSRGDVPASIPEFERALAEAERAKHEFLVADALHMLAIVASPEQAVPAHRAAIARVEASRDPRVRRWLAPLHNNLGWAYHERGDFEPALAELVQAERFYATRGDVADHRFSRWAVARAQRSLGRCADALPAQQAILAETLAAGQTDGYVHEELAECLVALGRPEEARPHFREAHRLLSQDTALVRDEPARVERLRSLGGG